jgi:hypothetical protein
LGTREKFGYQRNYGGERMALSPKDAEIAADKQNRVIEKSR